MNIKTLGQVFTPTNIVAEMLGLIKNNGRFLEPSCGDGAFFQYLPNNKIGIEIDKNVIKSNNILNIDFFDYSLDEKFDTIIGNPPYVKHQDINNKTKLILKQFNALFDARSNLYLYFIYKSILHLKDKGELIFITPRDFLKNTSSIKLNNFIFSQGTITDFIDLGDKKIFNNAQPNCAIWRFEKNNFKRTTTEYKKFNCINGQLLFTNNNYFIPFNKLFYVKVGAVSGADKIFHNEQYGNVDFVNSQTCKTKKTKKMIYGDFAKTCQYIISHKDELINRKIRTFNESNYWQWGRDYYKSEQKRIYVNTKTRNKKPFFTHTCKAYDGSILAIFPKFDIDKIGIDKVCDILNNTNWNELGFVCDGRFLFSQKSLENCVLDDNFIELLKLID
ncbi:class I SAM-dependent methyltransferase [Campylobacter sp. MG1]|uniref:class I SAM-dependent methyltransferase n=1 Tax=Campylobacter sp. MG1 TaxID=2976332 RepID=UPI00226D0C92|nr:class I SAM-dependent methyltransferase [Campylobacter sp. MG1]